MLIINTAKNTKNVKSSLTLEGLIEFNIKIAVVILMS